MSSGVILALSAVIRHEEGAALTELRVTLAEAQRVAAEAAAQRAAEVTRFRVHYQCLLDDVIDLANYARQEGLASALIDRYASAEFPRCVLCEDEAEEGSPWDLCASCSVPLFARGLRAVVGPHARECQTCGTDWPCGVFGGRVLCMPCASQTEAPEEHDRESRDLAA
jgi:hypothetical protein